MLKLDVDESLAEMRWWYSPRSKDVLSCMEKIKPDKEQLDCQRWVNSQITKIQVIVAVIVYLYLNLALVFIGFLIMHLEDY